MFCMNWRNTKVRVRFRVWIRDLYVLSYGFSHKIYVWVSFPIHVVPHMPPILVHVFISFPNSSWIICLFVTERARVLSFLFLMHIRRGRNSMGRFINQGGEGILYEKTLFCFVLHYVFFLVFFMVLWIMFSI